MFKLAVIVGATGVQGGSVVARFLKDPSFKIRGTTSNTASDASNALASQGVEMVYMDPNDEASIAEVFTGAHVVYAVTNFFKDFETLSAVAAMEVEYTQGVKLAKAAANTPTLEHYIWSTLPYSAELSQGRWLVPHYDGKARVDNFIKADKELLAKTTFLLCTYYPSNFAFPFMSPVFMILPVGPESTPVYSTGDTRVNVGIWVYAIITNGTLPPRPATGGLYVLGSHNKYKDWNEMFLACGRASGKSFSSHPLEFLTISFRQFENLWGKLGTEMAIWFEFLHDLKDKAWTVSGQNDVLITAEELLSGSPSGEEAALVSDEQVWRQMNSRDV
ncbi:hypothetical protein TruAng_006491 [Truncatella angustata]|nr:hypothetical protein TruAng_006491 [Truncatella angustata]